MASSIKTSPYGYDMSLFLDIRRNASATGGVDLVKNAIVGRILDYDLWYSSDYGFDLIGEIQYADPSSYNLIAARTESELLKDDRIQTIDVTISQPDSNNKVTVTIYGVLSDNESFELIGNLSLFNSEDFSFTL